MDFDWTLLRLANVQKSPSIAFTLLILYLLHYLDFLQKIHKASAEPHLSFRRRNSHNFQQLDIESSSNDSFVSMMLTTTANDASGMPTDAGSHRKGANKKQEKQCGESEPKMAFNPYVGKVIFRRSAFCCCSAN